MPVHYRRRRIAPICGPEQEPQLVGLFHESSDSTCH
jgi:hypothetical protein